MPERRGRSKGRRRRGKDGRGGSRGYRIGGPKWVDPFPGILGTKPEKMVLAELARRRIPFYFQYPIGDMPATPFVENWRVDFYIPSTKVVLEVFGDYWHTLGDQPMKDAERIALLKFHGYIPVVLWEGEILYRLQDALDRYPELKNPPVTGPPINVENATDDLRAMRRVALRRRRSVTTVKRRRSQRRRAVHVR